MEAPAFKGSSRHPRYSHAAFARMRDALEGVDMTAIWASHGSGRRRKARPTCTQPRCATASTNPVAGV
jgi:hypothetical protein